MTNENIIKQLKRLIPSLQYADDVNAVKGAIQALSQEPCDAISRQTYADWLDWLCRLRSDINSGMDMARVPQDHRDKYIDVLTEVIDKLPSVTQKSGKWIEKEGWDGDVYYECSICGEPFCLIEGTPTDNMYNFCPNCGAKMVEPQESEE